MKRGRAFGTAALLLALAAPASAQSVRLEVGALNAGELVTEQVRAVRLGNGGWARYGSIEIRRGVLAARLLYAPSHLHIGPVEDAPSRWSHRLEDHAEGVGWGCASVGAVVPVGYMEVAAMPTACTFVGARGTWWGGAVGAVPGLSVDVRVTYGVGLFVGADLLRVPPSRWTVLQRWAQVTDPDDPDWTTPPVHRIRAVRVGLAVEH